MKHYLTLSKAASLFALLLFVFLASCKKNGEDSEVKEPKALEINLLESADLFDAALKERNSDHAFIIEDVSREEDTLLVKVKGSGSEDSFRFIWDGRIQESYPMGIMLVLKYYDENGDFDKEKELLISVDLKKIIGDNGDINDFRFHVINGSQKQQTNLDPDGTVSNEDK